MIELISELTARAMEAVNQGSFTTIAALFLVAALTEVGMPFPLVIDGVLFLTGYRRGIFSPQVATVMLTLFAGRLVGSAGIYWAARFADEPVMNWVDKHFPGIHRRMHALRGKLGKKAPLAVAIARLTPGLLTPSTLAAGGIGLRYDHFTLGVAVSGIVSDLALVAIGFGAQRGLHFLGLRRSYWVAALAFVALMVLAWGIRWFILRARKRRAQKLQPPKPPT